MRSKLFFFIIIAFLLISSVYANNFLETNVNILLNEGKGPENYYLGNAFYYNISLENPNNSSINSVIEVSISDPRNNLVHKRSYSINISSNDTEYLFPFYNIHNKIVEDMYDLILFDQVGTYTIILSSSTPELFDWINYRKGGGVRQEPINFSHHIYSMSYFEKTLLDKELENIKEIKKYNLEQLDSQKNLGLLTAIGIFTTVIYFFLQKDRSKLIKIINHKLKKIPILYNWISFRKKELKNFLFLYCLTLPVAWIFHTFFPIPEVLLIILFIIPFSVIFIFMLPSIFLFYYNSLFISKTLINSYWQSLIWFLSFLIILDLISWFSKKYPNLFNNIKKTIILFSSTFIVLGVISVFFVNKSSSSMTKLLFLLLFSIWMEIVLLRYFTKPEKIKNNNT